MTKKPQIDFTKKKFTPLHEFIFRAVNAQSVHTQWINVYAMSCSNDNHLYKTGMFEENMKFPL